MNGSDTSALRRAVVPLIGLGAIGAAAVILLSPSLRPLVPPCLFRVATGLYCPGCGTGRAMHALAHLDVATALRMNVFSVVAIGPLVYVLARDALAPLGIALPWPRSMNPRWGIALAVGIIMFWVLRNIPVWPLTLLAPG